MAGGSIVSVASSQLSFLAEPFKFSLFLLAWPRVMLLILQLSAMDVSARTTMKGAAKCDKHCELQNSVNQ